MSKLLLFLTFLLSYLIYPCIALAEPEPTDQTAEVSELQDKAELQLGNQVDFFSNDLIPEQPDPSEPGFEFGCDISVVSLSGGSFQSLNSANQFCRQFDKFCIVRSFGDRFYESSYRRRHIFRGRGSSYDSARNASWQLYSDWLNRGRFYQGRFTHSFFFGDNCRG